MIVKLGFLVTASVAVYAVRQISIKSLRSPASTRKYSENGEISSKQDQNEKGDKEHFIDFSTTTTKQDQDKVTGISNAWSSRSENPSAFDDDKEPILPECRYHYTPKVELLLPDEKFDTTSNFQAKKDNSVYKISRNDHVTELVQLQNQIKELEGSEVELQRKLLKSYKLKEQESVFNELQRHLKIRTAEIEMLHATINSLQEEMKKLQKEIEKGVSAMKQLEMAKRKIKRLQSQIEIASNQMKDQVLMLENHITSLQSETATQRDTKADENVKVLEILELEILELKRKNKELQLEKRELTLKLIAAKSKITAFSNVTESEVVSEIEEEVNNLKIANKDLSKQIERFQKSKFIVVEELVYQKWVNACLRHEIQNHQRSSMSMDIKTQKNVKNFDRSLMSMHPPEAFMQTNADDSGINLIVKEQDSTDSAKTPNLQRTRRVSFNESVDNADASVGKMPESVEGVLVDNKDPVNQYCHKLALESENSIREDAKQPKANKVECPLDTNLNSGSQAEVKMKGAEQICGSGTSIEQLSESLMVDKRVKTRMKTDHSEMWDQRGSTSPSKNQNKIDMQELHFVNIFYFLMLILLVYLLFQIVGLF